MTVHRGRLSVVVQGPAAGRPHGVGTLTTRLLGAARSLGAEPPREPPSCDSRPLLETSGAALAHNGDAYSCDHCVDSKHRLGNTRHS